jgi:CheY-like chemotaxis protein
MAFREEPRSAPTERVAKNHRLALCDANDLPLAMARPRVLLVDDNDNDIFLTRRSLERNNCEVVSATSVTEAFRQIAAQTFDVLITDLPMPEAGDGFAVVTAMRHSQPKALTLVVSGYPDAQKAMSAILLQADEVLVKPFDVEQLAGLIDKRLLKSKCAPKPAKESVASILDRDLDVTMQRWLSRVEQITELDSLRVPAKERTEFLPAMMRSITKRLRAVRSVEAIDNPSRCARTTPLSPRLQRAPDRAGVTNPAGVHLRDDRTKLEQRGFYFRTAGHHDYCRRGGLSVEANHRQLSDHTAGGSRPGVVCLKSRTACLHVSWGGRRRFISL